MIYRRTQHALNRWVQCGLSSIFLALGFFNSQTKSTLAHLSVMQTVGQQANLIHDPQEIRQLTAFFAWASVADRPGQDYSYTSNFSFDPLVGNKASTDAVLWCA
jgi:nitric oxide reductase large subunit